MGGREAQLQGFKTLPKVVNLSTYATTLHADIEQASAKHTALVVAQVNWMASLQLRA
jgi:hypothetical protein